MTIRGPRSGLPNCALRADWCSQPTATKPRPTTPLDSSSWDTLIENPAGLSLPESERDVWTNAVSPEWFATYGIPLVSGRDFGPRDTLGSPRVALVNETFARKYFNHQNPIGRSFAKYHVTAYQRRQGSILHGRFETGERFNRRRYAVPQF